MENGEDLWLRYNDGSGWTTIATWASGSGFTNNSFNFVSVTLNSGLVNGAQFRIQCDAGQKNDQVYIDQVIIIGRNNAAAKSGLESKSPIIEGPNTVSDLLSLYPNPVKGSTLNVQFANSAQISYRIINVIGKVVKTGSTTKEIDVRNLEAGLYFVEANNGKTLATKRFIKE